MTNPTPHGQVPEALRLAEYVDDLIDGSMVNYDIEDLEKVAAELRRLHAENEDLRTQQPAPAAVVYSTPEEMFDAILTPQPAPQQEPVTHDEELIERLYWEFDSQRKTTGEERLAFKGKLRFYASEFRQRSLGKIAFAPSVSDDMMNLADRLGSEHEDVDPRAWKHLLVYAPQPAPATQQVGEVRRAELVPGVMHCAKCKFQLNRVTLCVSDGNAYAGNNKTEPCPNGCGPLWPVTWEQEAKNCWKALEEMHERLMAAATPQPSPTAQSADSQPAPVLDSLALMKVVMRADEALAGRCTRGTTNWAAAIGKAVQDAVLAACAPAESVLEDAARLDWLALAGPTSICAVIDRPHDGEIEVATDDVTGYGKTLREAIDAARKQGANHD